jgi:hypothetical protein
LFRIQHFGAGDRQQCFCLFLVFRMKLATAAPAVNVWKGRSGLVRLEFDVRGVVAALDRATGAPEDGTCHGENPFRGAR